MMMMGSRFNPLGASYNCVSPHCLPFSLLTALIAKFSLTINNGISSSSSPEQTIRARTIAMNNNNACYYSYIFYVCASVVLLRLTETPHP